MICDETIKYAEHQRFRIFFVTDKQIYTMKTLVDAFNLCDTREAGLSAHYFPSEAGRLPDYSINPKWNRDGTWIVFGSRGLFACVIVRGPNG